MATIIQHRPGFFSGFQNETKQFSTLEELLAIPFVANFKEDDMQFHQFSASKYSDKEGYEYSLIAEYKKGYVWYVVGYMDESDIIKQLPEFIAKYPMSKNRKIV
jgi:hypothetical protein